LEKQEIFFCKSKIYIKHYIFYIYWGRPRTQKRIGEIFKPMYNDGKLAFIILAALLITISIIASYLTRIPSYSFEKSFLIGVPFAFAWVVFAWAITDQSVLRKSSPYALIFFVILIEKMYWSIFFYLFPPDYLSDLSEFAGSLSISSNWLNLYQNAVNVYIFVLFVSMFILFFILWHLTKPKEFKQKTLSKIVLIFISAILMTSHLWIWRVFSFITVNIDLLHWYNLIFYGIPVAIALIIFAFVITNIKSNYRYVLYLLIGIFSLLPYLPIFREIFWTRSSYFWNLTGYFFVVGISYFVIFVSLVLLSKAKYIEQ